MPAIRFLRCTSANIPADAQLGEPVFVTDTGALYVGQGIGLPLVPVTDFNLIAILTSNLAAETARAEAAEAALSTNINNANNITDSEIAANAGINACKIGNGDVDNTHLSYLRNVNCDIQSQILQNAGLSLYIPPSVNQSIIQKPMTSASSLGQTTFLLDGNGESNIWIGNSYGMYNGPLSIYPARYIYPIYAGIILPIAQKITQFVSYLDASYESGSSGVTIGSLVLQGSNDTTNGYDGTWVTIDSLSNVVYTNEAITTILSGKSDSFTAFRFAISDVVGGFTSITILDLLNSDPGIPYPLNPIYRKTLVADTATHTIKWWNGGSWVAI